MRIKIAVCDSDGEAGAYLGELIASQKPDALVEVFASAEELLACDREFHIYFLDIKGIAGMEIARHLRQREKGYRSIIIFVTGYREYMEEAFDVQAFHYLMKPIDKEKFAQVLERACREAVFIQSQRAGHVLLKIMDREEGGHRKVLLQDIYYVESNNKNVIVHTVEGIFPVQGTMEEFEQVLGEGFYRCHRCYLVNMAWITGYNQREIQVADGETVMLAQKRYGVFVKAYLRYAKGGGLVNV